MPRLTHSAVLEVTLPVVASIPGPDPGLLQACVHCGLCTSSCPTYLETGSEADGPRGRIYLMRAVDEGKLQGGDADVRRHLDLCLGCRACESACPSGVRYGQLLESYRCRAAGGPSTWATLQRLFVFAITPHAGRLRALLKLARVLQRTGGERLADRAGLWRLLPSSLRHARELLPPLRPDPGRLPTHFPARGKRRAWVALFLGCAGDAFFPETNWATARVLQWNGCEVVVPRGQGCCGALHQHAGLEKHARRYAAANCRVFGASALADVDAIIVNAAGCGALLKDYGKLLGEAPLASVAGRLAARVRDVTEFLAELGPLRPGHPLPLRAVYHDACHLCHAQQIRQPPRDLLRLIPGLELVPLAESELCCGAAGSYNLTEPDMADRLGRRKAANVLASGARAVFAANVGCLLQIGRHLRAARAPIWVAHPMDALHAAYRGTRVPPR